MNSDHLQAGSVIDSWYAVTASGAIPTPALLVYPDRIEENVRRMISLAGRPDRLRPHVKTHKMSAVVEIMMRHGITRFKCATLAEAEMVARCRGRDILLALQPVGPQIGSFIGVQLKYPGSRFSTVVDCQAVSDQLAAQSQEAGLITDVWLDINNGMNRTGIAPGPAAAALYTRICATPALTVRGMHVYDGHVHGSDARSRKVACAKDFQPVQSTIDALVREGLAVPAVVAGGTSTFTFHVNRPTTEVSPGTCVLWDSGYAVAYPDLDFLPAAVVMTRMVSKPGGNLLCLDLGYKALAAEMPHPRVSFLNLNVSRFVRHSEEHLVVECPESISRAPGDVVYGIPWHICPTVSLYPSVCVVRNGEIAGEWRVDARDRTPGV